MLRVLQMSGEEVAAVPVEELSDVKALKRRLLQQHGMPPRFRQRLLLHDTQAILDDTAELEGGMTLQLLLLNFNEPSQAKADELTEAASHGSAVQAGSKSKPYRDVNG